MPKLICEIRLDSEIVELAKPLIGQVVIKMPKKTSCKIEQILFEATGTAQCEWSDDSKLRRFLKNKSVFSATQEFYTSRHTLAGGVNGIFELEAGSSTPFPFKCSLPQYLPATWIGKYGTIEYVAKVCLKLVDKPLITTSKIITVQPLRNLRLETHLLSEAKLDIIRNFHFGMLSLGQVQITVWLPLCGIASGQSIPVLCVIKNDSSVQFGGFVCVLTQLELFRSQKPHIAIKSHRKDICRVPRMVDILRDTYEYYCVLETDPQLPPTNQFRPSNSCQVIYEVWISLEGSFPRYTGFGYPNINTPGIPLIIGTHPLCMWDTHSITNEVMHFIQSSRPEVVMESLPQDAEVEEMLHTAEEGIDSVTELNLLLQLKNQK